MEKNEFIAHAYYTICNSGGIEIMLNKSNDGIYYRHNLDGETGAIYEAEIEYDGDGDAFVNLTFGQSNFANPYLMSDFIRMNIGS